MRPRIIPQSKKDVLHNAKKCIDIRNNTVHAIKANTNNRKWHNEVNEKTAIISTNQYTPKDNKAVYEAVEPFHVLSFGSGANTLYWGRYICVGGAGEGVFRLKYVDDGVLNELEEPKFRSKLEEKWEDIFEDQNLKRSYEPCTLLQTNREYTPDFYLWKKKTFIEIKGPPPNQDDFHKCIETAKMGFSISLFHGPPNGFTEYKYEVGTGKCTLHTYDSFTKWTRKSKRQKRKR